MTSGTLRVSVHWFDVTQTVSLRVLLSSVPPINSFGKHTLAKLTGCATNVFTCATSSCNLALVLRSVQQCCRTGHQDSGAQKRENECLG